MSAISTFFRHCPSCGHRFEIRLVSKKEVGDETKAVKLKEYTLSRSEVRESVLTLEADHPVTFEVPGIEEVEEFRYRYQCKRCNHEWFEERFKGVEGPVSRDYKGD